MRGYGVILGLVVVSIVLGLFVFSVSYILGGRELSRERLLGFECGFEVFESSRGKLDVKFYTIGLLFIIFDVEVVYFYPWSVNLELLDWWSNVGMIDFLLELVLGLVYLIRNGMVLFR